MELTSWLSLVIICAMGAMSPGPSLAVVLKNTLIGGRLEGIKTAIAHGFGVGLYAFGTAAGLGILIIQSPILFQTIQWAGAAFLAYLGIKALLSKSDLQHQLFNQDEKSLKVNSIKSGFLIAFFNPKLAIFFTALFSQFVSPEASWMEKSIMALTAASIDTLWYLLVAVGLSHSKILDKLRLKANLLDKALGLMLVLLAVRVITI